MKGNVKKCKRMDSTALGVAVCDGVALALAVGLGVEVVVPVAERVAVGVDVRVAVREILPVAVNAIADLLILESAKHETKQPLFRIKYIQPYSSQ
jgi:hypothetical protein